MREKLLTIATGENQQRLSKWLVEKYNETDFPKMFFPKERIILDFLEGESPRLTIKGQALEDFFIFVVQYSNHSVTKSSVYSHNKPVIDYTELISKQFNLTELETFNLYFSWAVLDGSTLFIDRPELGLPSSAQRLFARLIVRLINFGVKVVITTHSDFIIRQLNNLIILGSTDNYAVRDELMKQYNIKTEELLSFEVIENYQFNLGETTPQKVKVSLEGIYSKHIDQVIEDSEQQTMDIVHNLVC